MARGESTPIQAHCNRQVVIKIFGMANPNDEKAALGPAIGCRNAATGIMLLILGFKGHCRLAGLFLFVWVTLVGPEDIYICIDGRGDELADACGELETGLAISVLSWCRYLRASFIDWTGKLGSIVR
jgi:hypothetical protein